MKPSHAHINATFRCIYIIFRNKNHFQNGLDLQTKIPNKQIQRKTIYLQI